MTIHLKCIRAPYCIRYYTAPIFMGVSGGCVVRVALLRLLGELLHFSLLKFHLRVIFLCFRILYVFGWACVAHSISYVSVFSSISQNYSNSSIHIARHIGLNRSCNT